jgi:hypothetical protein
MLLERGVLVSYETVGRWALKFGPDIALHSNLPLWDPFQYCCRGDVSALGELRPEPLVRFLFQEREPAGATVAVSIP